jgi:predicted nucleic acid-binding protein
MPFVVDASVTACWLLPDEAHPLATAARKRLLHDPAVVPRIWWFEIRNLLIVNERRGRLDAAKSNRALRILRQLPIEFDQRINEERLLGLARTHRLSIYDAAYLELASRENVPLATLDGALACAARMERLAFVASDINDHFP